MKTYNSKNGDLLHICFKFEGNETSRTDICPEEQFLQVALVPMEKGKIVETHQHIKNVREILITQESWVVVKGKIKSYYYDVDGEFLGHEELGLGDCSVTFAGGHTCESLEEGTIIYEFKNGPYLGKSKDRELI